MGFLVVVVVVLVVAFVVVVVVVPFVVVEVVVVTADVDEEDATNDVPGNSWKVAKSGKHYANSYPRSSTYFTCKESIFHSAAKSLRRPNEMALLKPTSAYPFLNY